MNKNNKNNKNDEQLKLERQRAAQQRARIEARKRELRNKINIKNKEQKELSDKKTRYERMQNQISQAIQKLISGRSNISDSKEQLRRTYSSKTSEDEITKYEEQIEQINNLISKLSNTILPEIQKEIYFININFEENKRKIQDLNYQLNSI